MVIYYVTFKNKVAAKLIEWWYPPVVLLSTCLYTHTYPHKPFLSHKLVSVERFCWKKINVTVLSLPRYHSKEKGVYYIDESYYILIIYYCILIYCIENIPVIPDKQAKAILVYIDKFNNNLFDGNYEKRGDLVLIAIS